jgi:hypothetical protein
MQGITPLDEVLNTEPDDNDLMNLKFNNNSMGQKLKKVKSSKKSLKRDISGIKLRKSP